MTTAQAIVDRAAQLGIRAKLWERGDKIRIYARTARRDLSVYLECTGTAQDIEGAAFRAYCHTEQHPNWVRAQVAGARANFIGLFYAYVFEMYANIGPEPNGYGGDINGMIDAARAFVSAREAEVAALEAEMAADDAE